MDAGDRTAVLGKFGMKPVATLFHMLGRDHAGSQIV
jgi:hypothetical protein